MTTTTATQNTTAKSTEVYLDYGLAQFSRLVPVGQDPVDTLAALMADHGVQTTGTGRNGWPVGRLDGTRITTGSRQVTVL